MKYRAHSRRGGGAVKRVCYYLWPVLFFLLPLELVGGMEQDRIPLIPGALACLACMLIGFCMAHHAGATYKLIRKRVITMRVNGNPLRDAQDDLPVATAACGHEIFR
ncbi:MAG: hypothetical protein RRY65_07840, partial [Pseudoflavonifractor sp.]